MNTTTQTEAAHIKAAGKSTNASIDARRVAATPRGVGIGFNIYAERALNAELWDVEGKRYIDFGSGIATRASSRRSATSSITSRTPPIKWCRTRAWSRSPSA
jgi:hypothetical protein